MKASILASASAFLFILSCRPGSPVPEFAVPVDYRSWKKTLPQVLDYEVPGHGATYRIIYANEAAFQPLVDRDSQGRERISMKDGAIIIKEVYSRRDEINRAEPVLAIMVKESGNPGAQKNWLFFMKKPGQKPSAVTGRLCIGCHESANEAHPYFDRNPRGVFRDYLFAPALKR